MPHMIPEYLERRAYHIDGPEGIRFFFAEVPGQEGKSLSDQAEWLEFDAPAYFAEMLGEEESNVWSVERDESPQWYARLNAPGYMDATDWSGPYETEKEARDYIESTYDVHNETGEALGDEA